MLGYISFGDRVDMIVRMLLVWPSVLIVITTASAQRATSDALEKLARISRLESVKKYDRRTDLVRDFNSLSRCQTDTLRSAVSKFLNFKNVKSGEAFRRITLIHALNRYIYNVPDRVKDSDENLLILGNRKRGDGIWPWRRENSKRSALEYHGIWFGYASVWPDVLKEFDEFKVRYGRRK